MDVLQVFLQIAAGGKIEIAAGGKIEIAAGGKSEIPGVRGSIGSWGGVTYSGFGYA